MAKRRAIQFPGAMPEEVAFAKRKPNARRAALRVDSALPVAILISLFLVLPPALLGWRVAQEESYGGIVLAVLAGSVASVLVTFLAARAWRQFAPGERLFADATITGWLRRARAERDLALARELFDDPNVAAIELHVDKLAEIARALEARDARTHRHSSRVAIHASAIALELGLAPDEIARVRAAAKLHDIGTLRHPLYSDCGEADRDIAAAAGAELLAFTGDRELIKAVRHQRERYDGSGAPSGMLGPEIPLTSRILAVADAFDRIANERGQAAALKELHDESGTLFDPRVVTAFEAGTQSSPMTALRGALSGAFPRAAQGATELLRGTASVAAAASIATTAVVAGGVGVEHERANRDAKPAAAVAAAAQSQTLSGEGERDRDENGAKDDRTGKKDDSKQQGGDEKSGSGSGGDSNGGGHGDSGSHDSGSSGGSSDSSDSGSGSGSGSGESRQPGVVGGVTETLDQTVGGTTETLGGTVGGVTETLDSTTQGVGETVGGVVGGLTGGLTGGKKN